MAGDRTGHDDIAGTLSHHRHEGGVDKPEDGGDIGVHQLRPRFRVALGYRTRHVYAGIGEQDVHPGEGFHRRPHETSRLPGHGQVAAYPPSVHSYFGHQLGQAVLRPSGQHKLCPPLGQAPGHRPSNPGAGAGYDNDRSLNAGFSLHCGFPIFVALLGPYSHGHGGVGTNRSSGGPLVTASRKPL